MATFLDDTFTEPGTGVIDLTTHTGEVGATWSLEAGSSTTRVNCDNDTAVVEGATAGCLAKASGAPGSADYEVEGIIAFGANAVGLYGVAGRITGGDFTYYGAAYHQPSGGWILFKEIAGSFTVLSTWSDTPSPSTTRTVLLRMVGTALKMFVDGVERASVTDASISVAGVAGFRYFTASAGMTGTDGGQLTRVTGRDVSALVLTRPFMLRAG